MLLLIGEFVLTKYFGSQANPGGTFHGTKMGGHFKRSVDELDARGGNRPPGSVGGPVRNVAPSC